MVIWTRGIPNMLSSSWQNFGSRWLITFFFLCEKMPLATHENDVALRNNAM